MPRVVLDPNVLVSALITPRGASARLLVELRAGAFELLISPLLLTELEEVLRRPKFRRYVSEAEVQEFVALIEGESTVIEDPDPPPAALSEDPGDDYLIALARKAHAHALVSGDPHLTRLRTAIPVLAPSEFLESLPSL